MVVLEARGITKNFPGVKALDQVDLALRKGKIHCVVGENGAGKSTLVKILTGIYKSDQGSLFTGGKELDPHSKHLASNVAYVPQELNLFSHMTVAENLFLPFDQGHTSFIVNNKKIEEATVPFLKKLDMTVSASDVVAEIPISEQQLLQVARAIARQNFDVLILDEPTTSLTKQETGRLFNILKGLRDEGKAIVFISHKLDEIFDLGDELTVLRNGKMVGFSQIKDVNPAWVIQKMSGEEIDVDRIYRPKKNENAEVILQVKNLSGARFNDISFDVKKGEILGFAGLVGSGRSEIMQTIFGYLPEKGGSVSFSGQKWKFRDTAAAIKKGLIYLTEERKTHGILPFLNVKENVCVMLTDKVSAKGILKHNADTKISNKVIKEYNIKANSCEVMIINLSGGNQQKVLIGRTMEAAPKLIIFDEPTKGIDVKTKEEIYAMLKKLAEEDGLAIILISSELEELLKCSSRIITIYNGQKQEEFEGNAIQPKTILSSIIGIKENK